jgi:UDP-N-acetylmuramyl pentapeptide phosphotransferase/UDP-N-acetylglucosamine-1-phosphate transferase
VDLLFRAFGHPGGGVALQCAIAALCVLALSLALTALALALSRRLGVLAPPHDHSIHTQPISRLGGGAVFLSFALGMLLFEPLRGARADLLSGLPIDSGHLLAQIRGLLLGATVAVTLGLLDDLLQPRGLPAAVKLLGQILAVVVAFMGGLRPVQGIANPFAVPLFYAHPEKHKQILLQTPLDAHLGIAVLAFAFTAFWIVAMMNTINFLDGLDGLAGGVATIAAILLAIWSSGVHHDVGGPIVASEVLVLPPILLAAALIGFLVYNWYPASIIMGDSGAQFTGFTLGVLAVLGPAKIGTAMLILIVPIMDVAWVYVRRGRHFSRPDRGHLHHRLLEIGFSQRRIVLLFYGICIALGTIDLLLTRISKLLAFVAVALITVALLARLARRHPAAPTARRAPHRPHAQRSERLP